MDGLGPFEQEYAGVRFEVVDEVRLPRLERVDADARALVEDRLERGPDLALGASRS